MDDLEKKLEAVLRGLFGGTAAIRVKRQELVDPPAVVWDISLVQLPNPPAEG